MSWLHKVLILLVLVPGVVYLLDFAVAKVRGTPTENIAIRQYLAIPQKGNKLQFAPAESVVEECVGALFPHGGDRPCWYVVRHKSRQIDM